MSFTDYLARNPHPTEDEIREILSGHLCRCTGYAGIVAAVLAASGGVPNTTQEQQKERMQRGKPEPAMKPPYRELVTINGKNVVLAHTRAAGRSMPASWRTPTSSA